MDIDSQWQKASTGTHDFPISYPNKALIIVDAGPVAGGYIPGTSLTSDGQRYSCSREGAGGSISIIAIGY